MRLPWPHRAGTEHLSALYTELGTIHRYDQGVQAASPAVIAGLFEAGGLEVVRVRGFDVARGVHGEA